MILALLISLFFDRQIFTFIFEDLGVFMDYFFLLVSDSAVVITLFYIIPCIYLLKDRRRTYIPFILATLALSFTFSSLLKQGIERLRPFLTFDLVPKAMETTFSFPSNHAAIVFAALPLLYFLFKRFRVFYLIAVILVAFSRLYLGVHYLSDVIAGTILGLAVGYFIWYFKDEKVTKYSLEVKRQIMHVIWGSITVLLLHMEYINVYYIIAVLILGLVLSFIAMKKDIIIIKWFLNNFDRKDRIPGFGAITFFAGVLLSILLFSNPITQVSNISLASIMILTFGDSAATFFGKKFQGPKNPLNKNKTIIGTLTGIIFGTIGAMLFVSWPIALLASLAAMIIESTDLFRISDNITVPLVAGLTIMLLSIL